VILSVWELQWRAERRFGIPFVMARSPQSAAQNCQFGRFRSAGCVRAAALAEAIDRAETGRSI
jgi:ribosomal protein S12 methylthiotransferase accessory factor YcaO